MKPNEPWQLPEKYTPQLQCEYLRKRAHDQFHVSATCQRPPNFAILDFWASFNFNNFRVFNGPLQFESLPGSQGYIRFVRL